MKQYCRILGWLVTAAATATAGGCAHWNGQPVNLSLRPAAAALPAAGNPSADGQATVVRNQIAGQRTSSWHNEVAPGSSDQYRYPMAASSADSPTYHAAADPPIGDSQVQVTQFADASNPQRAARLWGTQVSPQGAAPRPATSAVSGAPVDTAGAAAGSGEPWQTPVERVAQLPGNTGVPDAPVGSYPPGGGPTGILPAPGVTLPPAGPPVGSGGTLGMPTPYADIFVNVQETQTGRLMLGAAVNSDAGLTGQIVIDEKNFDWRRVPTSFDDIVNGTAFRGAGQGFRIEALPGREVQRYMFQFTEPYLNGTRVSVNLSGYLFDRRFFDWDEQRLGGRVGMGYRITPDLSLAGSFRGEEVTISDPRVPNVPELDAAVGSHGLFSGRVSLTQDTRDIPFAPTQGYYLELAYEQVFGTFDYPRGSVDFRRYFLLSERVDGSGRHVLGFSSRLGLSGSQTPIFENFFAGGYSTIRGFDFRGASPLSGGVTVGGELSLLGSVEYLFPITADDMLKGVVFADYGTVEEKIEINTEDYRVALGAGLRISVPAMGPAPIALDFAVPVARENTDHIRNFSFFVGVSR